MSESFRVGDKVIVVHVRDILYTDGTDRFIGRHGIVVSGARLIRDGFNPSHLVDFGGMSANFIPLVLRKLDDDRDSKSLDTIEPLKVVRWTDCPWRPAGVRA